MTSDFAEKYAYLMEKQQENDSLKQEASHHYALLLQAFWQKYIPLTQVEKLSFTPKELKAWIEKKAVNRRQA